jgi:UDP-N-acetylglucosamine transferase subunit ALG13
VIFVTVGNFNGFPRLVSAVDRLKAQGLIPDEVLLQVGGVSDFRSEVCRVAQFLAPEEFEHAMEQASVVIAHGGAGTLIQALRAGKVPVVIPRRKKYGEHVDDHQLEGAQELAAQGKVILAREVAELPAAIEQARARSAQTAAAPPTQMIELVSKAIDELLAANGRT